MEFLFFLRTSGALSPGACGVLLVRQDVPHEVNGSSQKGGFKNEVGPKGSTQEKRWGTQRMCHSS